VVAESGDEESLEMDDDLLQVDLTSIDEDEQALVNFNLSPVTVEALMGRGITKLFPIQSACLQPLLAGRDIVARAKTGSGKTLAFAIPIVEQLLTERPRQAQTRQDRPRSLVMCPTRELALQVEKEIQGSAARAGHSREAATEPLELVQWLETGSCAGRRRAAAAATGEASARAAGRRPEGTTIGSPTCSLP
jgi:superfamily II DNA/RNA helicase